MFSKPLTVAGLTLWGAGLLTATAGAQNPGNPALLVTDYANYPNSEQTGAPLECDGGDVLVDQDGTGYTLNGGPLVATLGELGPLQSGDIVTAAVLVIEGCLGEDPAVISLTLKDAEDPFFDPATDQFNVGYEAVIAEAEGLTTVSLTLPTIDNDDCHYQLDLVAGYPLAVVGPGGSFYSAALRGDERRSMLVSARNGTLTSCTPTSTTTSTTEPPTTTTEPPGTTTTAGPTTTTEPATLTTAAPNDTAVVTSSTRRSMPATGTSNAQAGLAAAALILGGIALVAIGRRQKAAV